MNLLALLISALLTALLCVGCVVLGYWMGRNSADKPAIADVNVKREKQIIPVEPYRDYFDEAMESEPDKRIPTI
jgi:hypothetical protein